MWECIRDRNATVREASSIGECISVSVSVSVIMTMTVVIIITMITTNITNTHITTTTTTHTHTHIVALEEALVLVSQRESMHEYVVLALQRIDAGMCVC